MGAVARQASHDVSSVDGVLIGNPKVIARRVAACEPEVVGTSTATIDRLACIRMIREIRKTAPKAFIVVGGSHFSHSAVDAMESVAEIDAVVVGEGEVTFLELLERLSACDNLTEVKGLVFRDKDGQIVRNEPRELMKDINHLPMPAWDLFELDRYYFHSHGVGKMKVVKKDREIAAGVMTTRGCPQSCVFCANSLNKKMRYLDPALAVDQLEVLQKKYGVKALNIYDDDFLTNQKHAAAFCEELLRRNCRFTWWCGARPARLDQDVLKLMKRAGCSCISFGLENGTNEVLRKIRKNVTTEQVYEAMKVVGKVGFEKVNIFLILGLPGETPDTVDQTARFVQSLRSLLGEAWQRKTMIGQLPLIYPGTEMEAMGYAEGCLPAGFSWNKPYREPYRYLPLINHRYAAVPHFQNRHFPLPKLCEHIRKYYWDELLPGRRRRYRMAIYRRLKVAMRLG